MGLDISYYEVIELVKESSKYLEEFDYREDVAWLHNQEALAVRLDGLPAGYYRTSGLNGAFRAGSYSGYNRWREMLAELVGTTCARAWKGEYTGAFAELINFSDAEGTIGPTTSTKLAKDFAEWAPEAGKGDFREIYDDFRKAFETAAGRGAVRFH
jgi:hypothetical protein